MSIGVSVTERFTNIKNELFPVLLNFVLELLPMTPFHDIIDPDLFES